MTKQWRPDDWVNPFKSCLTKLLELKLETIPFEFNGDIGVWHINESGYEKYSVAYEAGADAMLEALLKKGERVDIIPHPQVNILKVVYEINGVRGKPVHGWIVFIPDVKG